jgi:hypothetical protein
VCVCVCERERETHCVRALPVLPLPLFLFPFRRVFRSSSFSCRSLAIFGREPALAEAAMLQFKRKRLLLASAGCVALMLLITPTHGDSDSEQRSYKMARPLEVTSVPRTSNFTGTCMHELLTETVGRRAVLLLLSLY